MAILRFKVSNFEEAYRKDPESQEKADATLAQKGALPARVDWSSKEFAVEVTNPGLSASEIVKTLRGFGFRAKPWPRP